MKKTMRLSFQTFQYRLGRINWSLTFSALRRSSPLFLNPRMVAALVAILAVLFLSTDLVTSITGRAIDPHLRPTQEELA